MSLLKFNIINDTWADLKSDTLPFLDFINQTIQNEIKRIEAEKAAAKAIEDEKKRKEAEIAAKEKNITDLENKINQLNKAFNTTLNQHDKAMWVEVCHFIKSELTKIRGQLKDPSFTEKVFREEFEKLNKKIQYWESKKNSLPKNDNQNITPGGNKRNKKITPGGNKIVQNVNPSSGRGGQNIAPGGNKSVQNVTSGRNIANKIPQSKYNSTYTSSTKGTTQVQNTKKWDALDTILVILLTLLTVVGGIIYWLANSNKNNNQPKSNLNSINNQKGVSIN